MKKIGLLTMSCIPNYGAMLQTYATYLVFNNIIKQQGYNDIIFEVINYEPLIQKKRYSRKVLIQCIINGNGFKNRLRNIRNLFRLRRTDAFKLHNMAMPFQQQYLSNSNRETNNINSYDAYIVGSDQTWNPRLMEDNTFLLDFTDSFFKYSYAASIGVEQLSDVEINKFQRYLSSFRNISVREDVGCEIIRKIIPNKTITQVLDPTLLLTNEEWSNKESKQFDVNKKYIFVYLAKLSDDILTFAKQLAVETGYVLKITATPDLVKGHHDKNYIGMITPEAFISYIHHAEYVITNSFHGIAFSINFNKEFYTAYNSSTVTRTNSRLASILRMFDLECRLIGRNENISKPIDYKTINKKLKKMREFSKDYIRSILKDVEEYQ